MTAPLRLTDPARLSALSDTNLLDSPPEYAFDRLTQLACRILHTPVVLVSLVDQDRQFFKSSIGLPAQWAAARQTPLSHSFCQHVVMSAQPLIVSDAAEDPFLRDNLAIPEIGVRAYAGIPLITSDGHTLGSFCAIDTQPREWTEEDLAALQTLADSVSTEIELRGSVRQAQRQAQDAVRLADEAAYQAREAERARRENQALLDSAAEGIYGIDSDGHCTFINASAARMLGYLAGEVTGENLHRLVHHHRPDGSSYAEQDCPIFQATAAGVSSHVEDDVFWRRDGFAFPVDYRSSPLFEDGEIVGAVVSFSDITVRKEAEAALREALAKERHVAETLQRTILEDLPADKFPGLAVASCYAAAWQEARIGGDFYDAFALDGGRVAFIVGDASGKGLEAAVRTAEVKFALRALLHQDPAPASALARLNDFVCAAQRLEARAEDTFVAMTVAVVEAATGEVSIATGGAEPPLLLRAAGGAEEIRTGGVPVGFLAEQEYGSRDFRLDGGDILLLATDGVTEARRDKEFLGYEGMVALAEAVASPSAPLRDVAQAVLDGARDFAGGTLHDDACLLLIRRSPL